MTTNNNQAEVWEGEEWRRPFALVSNQNVVDKFDNLFHYARQFIDKNGPGARVILLSRRLMCLYSLAREAGHPDLQGTNSEFLSDRTLEMTREEDWSGRRVLIIDDVVIHGTTLLSTYRQALEVNSAQPDLIETCVAVIDQDRILPQLDLHLKPNESATFEPLRIPSEEVDQLAVELATVLFRSSTPYLTDFPLPIRLPVDSSVLDQILASTHWYAADVTVRAPMRDGHHQSYSLVPREELETRIRVNGPSASMATATLMKIRLFVERMPDSNSVLLRIVPIVIPGPLFSDELNQVLTELSEEISLGDISEILENWSPPAKHRLLQMHLSSCLLAEFWRNHLEDAFGALQWRRLDRPHVDLFFGRDQSGSLLRAFNATVQTYNAAVARGKVEGQIPVRIMAAPESPLWARARVRRRVARIASFLAELKPTQDQKSNRSPLGRFPEKPQPGECLEVDWLWVHEILNIFGFTTEALSREQQDLFRQLPFEELLAELASPSSATTELLVRQGISLRELTEAFGLLDPSSDPSWTAIALSFAIDIGTDMGVAVPTTRCGSNPAHQCTRANMLRCGPIFRQYRPGEASHMFRRSLSKFDFDAPEPSKQLDLATSAEIESDDRIDVPKAEGLAQSIYEAALPFAQRRVSTHWVGQVVEVSPNTFSARVADTVGRGPTYVVDVPRSDLDPSDAQRVAPGMGFAWVRLEPVEAIVDVRDQKSGVPRDTDDSHIGARNLLFIFSSAAVQ